MVPPLVITAAVVPLAVPAAAAAETVAVATNTVATTNPGALRQLCYEAAMRRMEAKEKPE
jgi:hypothetical protein